MRARLILVGLLSLTVVVLGADRAGAGGGCHDPDTTERATVEIAYSGMCVHPGTTLARPGDTITFRNEDKLTHNLYGAGWGVGDLLPGAEASHTFTDPGTYAFTCTLHPGMVGTVVVAEPRLAASSTDAGGLSLAVVLGILALALLGIVDSFTLGSRWR
jgi:plastocyanin